MITREGLQLTPSDIEDRKLILRSSKSGKERETVFILQEVADHLREYITSRGTGSDQRIFPISYIEGRRPVSKVGKKVEIHLRPIKGVDILPGSAFTTDEVKNQI